ncbi:TetR/AcrR family transcriptional regulator [Sphingobium sp. EM0848]|uniref:TetR/AcrR family transcriptional regulator n=1 Tax=Sphingobium sp. EM0848 TaxID=2743473 RepID=UPI00159CB975|nr:TetR/AcrR family transcriptional regulator [Sphingobium sp. EM0848]
MTVANAERQVARQPRGDATRQSILEAAERVFADLGYAAARLEDVAQAVGIRRPSIVYYFPGKQQLYDQVEADIFASMHDFVLKRVEDASDPMARLLALLDAWLDFLVERPAAARIIQRLIADSAPRGDNPVRFSETALRDIEAVITMGVEVGAFRPVSAMHILNGVAGGALFYVCNGGQLGEERSYDPANPVELSAFRALLHKLAEAAVLHPGEKG